MQSDPRIIVRAIATCRAVEKPHAKYHVIHEGEDTFRMVLHQELLPGQSSSIHAHSDAPELYLVIRGTLQIRTDIGVCEVAAGYSALVPAGVPHGARNEDMSVSTISILLLGSGYSKESVRVLSVV